MLHHVELLALVHKENLLSNTSGVASVGGKKRRKRLHPNRWCKPASPEADESEIARPSQSGSSVHPKMRRLSSL